MPAEKLSISILVPCYNEEKTIRKCVLSWLNQSHPADEIIVVNDCSTDNTPKILEKFGDKITVVNLPKNTGNKSFAQEEGLAHVKTDIFVTTDADTVMDKYFIERVYNAFQDKKNQVFAGYVKSLKCNWLTACREIDYLIGQDLHKVAQYNINFLFVIPGCAGAFRTEIFKKFITFDHDTLTEDLDFTYKIHKNELKIFYDRHAVVYTQDPDNLRSYINQMRRWYSGGWQNLRKHIDILNKPARALEISMVYFEGLIFYPLMFLTPVLSVNIFLYLMAYGFLLGLLFGAYSAIKRKRLDLFLYSPLFLFITYIHAYIFLEQFIKEMVLQKKNMTWFHPERRGIS
jgi:poly-beta-1,6-N-acetyl-D-glucosamine synthase